MFGADDLMSKTRSKINSWFVPIYMNVNTKLIIFTKIDLLNFLNNQPILSALD